jgi:nitrite reductase/ring-hydroxylating ferredoxin subunit
MSEFIEQTVCKTSDLQNNEKKVYELGNAKILLIKQNDKFNALGTKCSHYGAPLINGVLYSGHISCPWHGACFNVTTGDIEDFPGCDSLPSYQVTIKGSDVIVKAKKSDLLKNARSKTLTSRNTKDGTTFVIVGGGPSGLQCAETLRQEGFAGRIVLITNEDSNPYDRTKLSKALNTKVEDIILRSKEYLEKSDIEVLLNTTIKKLDTKANSVLLDNGSNLKYDKIFLGTGASPKKCEVEGSSLKNICYVKTYRDANYIADNASDKRVAIIGTSFIGINLTAISKLNFKTKFQN